jgi:hypothetical protein
MACALYQNYPNPFNPATVIRYSVAAPSAVEGRSLKTRLSIFDLLGREVAVLVNEEKPPGTHLAMWDASGMPSGMYFYRFEASGGGGEQFRQTKKMVLMK